MLNSYDDIIHLSRPRFDERDPMPRQDRAAQFAPFAALVGYDDAVAETVRRTDCKRELTEDEQDELNARLRELSDRLPELPEVRVSFFIKDRRKAGGCYTLKRGAVRLIDSYARTLVFTDGARIGIDELEWLEFPGEEDEI